MEYLKTQVQMILFWFLKRVTIVKYVVENMKILIINGANHVNLMIVKKNLQIGARMKKSMN